MLELKSIATKWRRSMSVGILIGTVVVADLFASMLIFLERDPRGRRERMLRLEGVLLAGQGIG